MTTIKLKNGSGAPTAGDLAQGEPALDLTNKRLYTEDSGGTVIEVGTNPGVDVTFADNRKAVFGADSDLQIYHDGSASYIADTGTGTLNIKASGSIRLRGNDTDELLARFNENGSNQFYYDSSEKLATTNTGIDVTGSVTADGLVVGDTSFSFSAVYIISSATGESELRMGDTDTDAGSIAYTNSDDTMTFRAAAGARMSLDSTGIDVTGTLTTTGSVGIGTSSPASELHVKSSGTSSDTLTIENSTGNGSWRVKEGSSSNALLQGYNASNSETIRLDPTSDTFFNGGNVGIGTSSPDTLLHLSDTAGGAVIRLERNDTSIVSTDVYGEIQFEGQDSSAGSAAGIRGKILGVAEGATGEMALAFQTAGGYGASTERMRIDASGNLLVGGTSYEQAGSIGFKGTGEYSSILSSGAGGEIYAGGAIALVSNGYQISVTTGNAQTYKWHNGTTRSMTLDSSGNLLVGQSSTTTPGTGNTTTGISLRGGDGAIHASRSGNRSLYANRSGTDGPIISIEKDGVEVGSIGTADGELTIGNGDAGLYFWGDSDKILPFNTTTNAVRDAGIDLGRATTRFKDFYLSGEIYNEAAYNQTTGFAANMYVNSAGRFFRSTSSERYKNSIQDATHGLTELLTLRPVTYKGNDDGDLVFGGLIAEEVHDAGLTEFVQYNEESQPDALAYGNMVSLCIKAIQEQNELINDLRARVAQRYYTKHDARLKRQLVGWDYYHTNFFCRKYCFSKWNSSNSQCYRWSYFVCRRRFI